MRRGRQPRGNTTDLWKEHLLRIELIAMSKWFKLISVMMTIFLIHVFFDQMDHIELTTQLSTIYYRILEHRHFRERNIWCLQRICDVNLKIVVFVDQYACRPISIEVRYFQVFTMAIGKNKLILQGMIFYSTVVGLEYFFNDFAVCNIPSSFPCSSRPLRVIFFNSTFIMSHTNNKSSEGNISMILGSLLVKLVYITQSDGGFIRVSYRSLVCYVEGSILYSQVHSSIIWGGGDLWRLYLGYEPQHRVPVFETTLHNPHWRSLTYI